MRRRSVEAEQTSNGKPIMATNNAKKRDVSDDKATVLASPATAAVEVTSSAKPVGKSEKEKVDKVVVSSTEATGEVAAAVAAVKKTTEATIGNTPLSPKAPAKPAGEAGANKRPIPPKVAAVASSAPASSVNNSKPTANGVPVVSAEVLAPKAAPLAPKAPSSAAGNIRPNSKLNARPVSQQQPKGKEVVATATAAASVPSSPTKKLSMDVQKRIMIETQMLVTSCVDSVLDEAVANAIKNFSSMVVSKTPKSAKTDLLELTLSDTERVVDSPLKKELASPTAKKLNPEAGSSTISGASAIIAEGSAPLEYSIDFESSA